MGKSDEQGPGNDAVRRQQDAWRRRDAQERQAQQGPRPTSWEGAAVPPRIRRRRGPIGRLFGRRRGGGS